MRNDVRGLTEELISARIQRLPLSGWYIRTMAIVAMAHFFDGSYLLTIAFVLPVLVGLWHITLGEIGLLISAGFAGQMVGAIGLGWAAENVLADCGRCVGTLLSCRCSASAAHSPPVTPCFWCCERFKAGPWRQRSRQRRPISMNSRRRPCAGRVFLFFQSSFAVGDRRDITGRRLGHT